MKFYNIIIIFSLLFLFLNLRAQSDIVAEIGINEITKEEFRLRYELSPRILPNDFDNVDSIKLKFLYSLVAEKLLAMDATDLGLLNSDKFKFYYKPIEKIFVRDEVFKLEIKDQVKVTIEDITSGMNKYVQTLNVKAVASRDSSIIFDLYKLILIKGSIDSLLTSKNDTSIQISKLEINFGDLDNEKIEDQLYGLKIGEITEPIQNKNIWFIFELAGIKPNIPESSQEKFEDEVRNILENRRTRNLYDKFYEKNFSGFSIKADTALFVKFSEAFYHEILNKISSLPEDNKVDKYFLTDEDILNVKNQLGSEFLQNELFRTAYGSVTVYDFLSDLTIVDVSFPDIIPSSINKVLSKELKRFMQQEYIYQIGENMGVQFSDEIKFQLKLWKDNILSQMARNSYHSQIDVTDGEIEQYYNDTFSDTSEITQINLQLLTTSKIDQVEEMINMIDDGKSFEQIASEFDSSQGVYLQNISEFNKLKEFGEAMDIISELDSGEVYGPVKTSDGFSLVKVVESTVIPDSIKNEIENSKSEIYQKIFYQKLNQLLEDRTIELANKHGISINENLMKSEHYSDINIFVHRYMGFGGRITAVPYTTPFFNWFYRWKQNSTITPQ